MNTIAIRKYIEITQEDLAEKFAIPIETLVDWDTNDSMPEYVYRLIASYYVLSERHKIDIAKYVLDICDTKRFELERNYFQMRAELITWEE